MPDWPHAPPHRLLAPGTFFVTAGTYQKRLHFHTHERIEFLHNLLLNTLKEFGWHPQAWAVLANHYHVVTYASGDPATLKDAVSKVHTLSAACVNKLDGCAGRKVWFQFRDTALTYKRSYFARLRYVHENPVRHGLVNRATDYPWCSAGWFEQKAAPAFRAMIGTFKTDRLNVWDDFDAGLDSWRWRL